MTSQAIYDLDEDYRNALDKDAEKESRLGSISRLDFRYPLDELVLDSSEDVDIRIAALDCLDLGKSTLYDIDIDNVSKELALAVIGKYYFGDILKAIALSHKDDDFRLKAVENKFLKDENALKYIIENDPNSNIRAAAARHPSLNDSEFLEKIAVDDMDKNVRSAAASNYSTQDICTLMKIIEDDDEDIVRISALKNLVFRYNLFYPNSNKKYNFKKKFNKISRYMIVCGEDYIPKKMNTDERIADFLNFDLLGKIFRSSVFEEYDELRDNLIEYFEKILFYRNECNPFDERNMENGSFKKELYDDFKVAWGDDRHLTFYKLAYDGRCDDLKEFLDNLKSLDCNLEESIDSKADSSFDNPIDESYFIDLAYNEDNEEMIRLALEAISDNSVLMYFAINGMSDDIRKTAIKRSTDLISLVDMAINRIDFGIPEANLYDEDWICEYVSSHLDEYFFNFNTYDFYSHDLKHYNRLFDNRLESFYYDAIAENYYRDTLAFCLFKKIRNYFDLILILKHTRSFALRDLIIYKVNNPVILAYMALNAMDERIRYTAFGRIESKAVLKHVYLNSEDFRIKLLYLSNIDDSDILKEAFLKEENDVLRKAILDNVHFKASPEIIEHCIELESFISSYAEKKFAKQFVDYRLLNKKFKK